MSEERRQVLAMLEAGKITAQEAQRLLEALGEDGGLEEAASQGQADLAQEQEALAQEQEALAQEQEALAQGQEALAQEDEEEDATGPREEEVGPREEEVGPGSSWQSFLEPAASALGEIGAAVGDVVDGLGEEIEAAVTAAVSGDEDAPQDIRANAYPAPALDQPVTGVWVDWVAGMVELRTAQVDQVQVTEFSNRPLDQDSQMKLTCSGGVLRVSWTRKKRFFGNFGLRKYLLIQLPAQPELEWMEVHTVSSGVTAVGFAAQRLELHTVSGRLEAQGLSGDSLRLETVSGSLQAQGCSARELRLSSTSGKLSAPGFAGEEVKLQTVSGGIWAQGCGQQLAAKTVSGQVDLRLEQRPERATLESVSGKLALALPEGSGFTANYSSVSGGFHSDFVVSGSLGGKSGRVVSGDGGTKVTLHTTSGWMGILRGEGQNPQ